MSTEIVMAEPFFDGNVLALVKNGIIQDFFADFNSLENDLVGSIFIGEVDRISKDLNSSFIKLPFNKMGLSLIHISEPTRPY